MRGGEYVDLEKTTSDEWRRHPLYSGIACSVTGQVATIKSGRLLSQFNENGYKKVSFKDDRLNVIRFAHRLVAECFIGISSLQVNHIDGNKKNNTVSNLEFVTARENTRHAIRLGLKRLRPGNAIFNEEKILKIAAMFNSGKKRNEIADELSVGHTTINSLIAGHTYKEFSHLFKKETI
jgi:hypothetical protein